MDGPEEKKDRRIRDWLLFLAGLGGVAHETLLSASADPTLIAIFAAMLGLPFFLRKDERS